MIITLTGADFSGNNVGTLSTWLISKNLKGTDITDVKINNLVAPPQTASVDKGSKYEAEFYIKDGYTLSNASVTMGGVDISDQLVWNDNNTGATLTIAEVTGNVYISITALSESGSGEDEESGSGDLNITSTATFESGATNATGEIATSSYFQTASIDVSAYRGRTLEFTFIKYTGSTGNQSSNYCGFVNSSGKFTAAIQAPVCDLGNTKGESYVATIAVPSDATIFKTTWFIQNAVDKGVYSGAVSDFSIIVKNA